MSPLLLVVVAAAVVVSPAVIAHLLARPAYGIVAVVLAVALPIGSAAEGGGGISVTPADLVAVLLVVVTLARALVAGRTSVHPALSAMLLACVGAGAIATASSVDTLTSLGGFLRYAQAFALVPMAVYLAIQADADKQLVLWTLVAIGVGQGLLGVYQALTATGAGYGEDAVRAIGTFSAEEIMSLPTMLTASLMAVTGLALHTRGRSRWLGLSMAPLICAGLLASLSRGAWLAASAGLLVIFMAWNWRATVVGALATALVGLALVSTLPAGSVLSERIGSLGTTSTEPDQSVRDRYALWGSATRMWASNAVTGVGPKGFADYRDTYITVDFSGSSDISDSSGFRRIEILSPHNQYLLILSEQGLLGLVSYAVLFAVLLGLGIRRLVSRPPGRGGPAPDSRHDLALRAAAVGWLVSYLVRCIYGDLGGSTVMLDSVMLGTVMAVALPARTAARVAPRVPVSAPGAAA